MTMHFEMQVKYDHITTPPRIGLLPPSESEHSNIGRMKIQLPPLSLPSFLFYVAFKNEPYRCLHLSSDGMPMPNSARRTGGGADSPVSQPS